VYWYRQATKESDFYWYIPNQWIEFFVRFDWLLKLGIVTVIHLPAFFWILRASFPYFSEKRNFLVLIVHWFGKTIIHLHFGK